MDDDKKRADALAATIAAIANLTTTEHETKEQFISRVRYVLSVDPDERYAADLRAAYSEGVTSRINASVEVIEQVAHRTCSQYRHSNCGWHSYIFESHTLQDFVRGLLNNKI